MSRITILGAGLSGLAAATILAKAGKEVHVHEIRNDSGARFDGDFQGLENWTSDTDFFDEMRGWGLDPSSFKATEFSTMHLVHPDDEITHPTAKGVAFRIVERGTAEHCIDQGFKRMALQAGVTIHYNSKIAASECDIIAAGPKKSSAVAFGEVFKTDHENVTVFHLNDKLAPGSYAYLIVIDGIGLICTCLWRKQKKSQRFLNETIAWYDEHYDLNRQPIKRVGGKGDFYLPDKYLHQGKYYVGEAGGLQDFMWGFGMRYAITSGVLAAQAILGQCDYEKEVRNRLLPSIKTSVINRYYMNNIGDKELKKLAIQWQKHQDKTGDGLIFMKNLYKRKLKHKLLWPLVKFSMLQKEKLGDGRLVWRLPFRQAKARDEWQESAQAKQVASQWKEFQRSGATTSFDEKDA